MAYHFWQHWLHELSLPSGVRVIIKDCKNVVSQGMSLVSALMPKIWSKPTQTKEANHLSNSVWPQSLSLTPHTYIHKAWGTGQSNTNFLVQRLFTVSNWVRVALFQAPNHHHHNHHDHHQSFHHHCQKLMTDK